MKRKEIRQIVEAIKFLRENAADEQALEAPYAYAKWRCGVDYTADDRIRMDDKIYKCLQSHTSQDGWEPDKTPALWVEIAKPGEYREIKDGMLATEAFSAGEIGWYQGNGNLYESLIANNVWTPFSYPAGWKKL